MREKFVIPVGARVRVAETSRSPVLRGLSGVVVSFDGRHAEVKLEGQEQNRKLNPNDVVVLAENGAPANGGGHYT